MQISKEEVILSDTHIRLKEEADRLKSVLASLTSERDELRNHICPELTARYFKEIGNFENRLNYQKIIILETKRRIEIARAALNREKIISEQEVDEQVSGEYKTFHEKVNEEFRRADEARQSQEEREEKQAGYEKEWQERYGSGENAENSDSENTGKDTNNSNDGYENAENGQREDDREGYSPGGQNEEAGRKKSGMPDAKSLYRKIIKKLHPDVNPDITEHEKQLFYKAVQAYRDGDIVTLQEIYNEIFGMEEEPARELTDEELAALCEKLKIRIKQVRGEIEIIKKNFPYTMREFLGDGKAVREKREHLEYLISQNEKTLERLGKMYEEILEEMRELQNKKSAKRV